jgi:peptidoglycan/LPS O-acetylase OafA/YrhL
MSVGCIGLFRDTIRSERRWIRYLSDASYWLYLTHLPLVILGQAAVRQWNIPGELKMLVLTASVTIILLAIYHLLVRYTWIGTFLNGPRKRVKRQVEREGVSLSTTS